MINHSNCDHPSTRAARAKCRRLQRSGEDPSPKSAGASPKEVDFSGSGGAKAQTPGFKSDECHICGVERIEFRGTDAWTGLLVYVGERCFWRIKRSSDVTAVTR